jgi:hypothetical protein
MSGTTGALTMDTIAGSAARWALAAVVIPAALAGAYWGISSVIQAREDIRDLRNAQAHVLREVERVDRGTRLTAEEWSKALEAAVRRGEERRQGMERDSRDRALAIDQRINNLEQQLGHLSGGVIELRTEQRGIKATVDRIEGAVSGLAARPAATTTAVLPVPTGPAGPARAIDQMTRPWGTVR